MKSVVELGERAKAASRALATASTSAKNSALLTAADLLLERAAEIQASNDADLEAAEAGGMAAGPLDRLRLTDARLAGMANGLRTVAGLADPVGEVLDGWTRPNGLQITRVRVPLGVIAIIYENRPNVTSDAAGLCIKAGNAALLRGSSTALRSNIAVASVLRDALAKHGLPEDARDPRRGHRLRDGDRGDAAHRLRRLPDPAWRAVVDPEHPGERDRSGDHRRRRQLSRLRRRVRRSRRSGEDRRERQDATAERLQRGGVAGRARRRRRRASSRASPTCSTSTVSSSSATTRAAGARAHIEAAADGDFGREFLDLKMSVAVAKDLDAAIEHVNRYGTGHTEAILTRDLESARRFTNEVDAAAVLVNASTRFTDGEEFGFGAEIGISTQKLHARGPMGLRELTTYKYVVWGDGQIRG